VQTKYGHQEGAAVGYNPQRRGRKSFHPLLAVAAGTRLCPYYRFRGGDTVTASQWEGAKEECQQWLGRARVWLNRGDLGLGHGRIWAWHEAPTPRPYYLFRLKLTANVKRAIAAVPESSWQGPARLGVLQVAEINLRLHAPNRHAMAAFLGRDVHRRRRGDGLFPGRLPRHRFRTPSREEGTTFLITEHSACTI
jgi:hypothetical protein